MPGSLRKGEQPPPVLPTKQEQSIMSSAALASISSNWRMKKKKACFKDKRTNGEHSKSPCSSNRRRARRLFRSITWGRAGHESYCDRYGSESGRLLPLSRLHPVERPYARSQTARRSRASQELGHR